jgi:MFS family permease
VLIYNLEYSVGSLPQHGPLRFGLPMVVVLAAAVGERWPTHRRFAFGAQLAAVALSSIWALEAFGYTLATFAVIAFYRAWILPRRARLASLARTALIALAACAAAHLLLAAVTLAASGELPDWGRYLAYLEEFLFGDIGDITYDFSRWSAGLPVGAAYLASAAAFVLVVRARRDLVDEEGPALIVLCGATAYGIALFSYFMNRSADHILPYVSLPALIAGVVWLSLLLRGVLAGSRAARLGGLAFALSVAVLLVSVAWSSIGDRVPRTALAHVAPGGEPLGEALDGLWDPPPLNARAPLGEALVERYMPGDAPVPILASPDLETEVLLRSGRSHGLGLSYAREDSFVTAETLPHVREAVDDLQPGDLVLLQSAALEVLASYRAQPSRDPLADPVSEKLLVPLQEYALKRIGQRFRTTVVDEDADEFVVVRLDPRSDRN